MPGACVTFVIRKKMVDLTHFYLRPAGVITDLCPEISQRLRHLEAGGPGADYADFLAAQFCGGIGMLDVPDYLT
jgi:hypothetical protein